MALAQIREINFEGFWKPPGYGKSRKFRGKSYSREIGKFLGNASKNWQISGNSANLCESLGKIGKIMGKIGKFLGNVSRSPEIHFPGATFRDTGNVFSGEEVRHTGQKPPGL